MLSKKAAEVGAAFQRYVKYSDKSEIEGIEIDDLEEALIHFSRDKSMPFYNAMERQLDKLKEEEGRRRNEEEDMFGSILLEPEHEELLYALVEAARNVPREKRDKFIAVEVFGGGFIQHPGLPDGRIPAYKGDVEVLAHEGLLLGSYSSQGNFIFDVRPLGFRYYEYLKQRNGQPIQELETTIGNYLNAEQFQKKYSTTYKKWAAAEAMLWESDSEKQLTTIGHLCREAMQEFATALVNHYQPPNVEKNKASTVARIRAILEIMGDKLGKTEKPFLDAILAYWGTASDLVQRQEHGAQREKVREPLVWEDGRRVVFQTAVVMFEIDSALSRIR